MTTTNVQILLKMTEDLEERIEEAIRKGGYRSRQEFILEAVRNSLKRERI